MITTCRILWIPRARPRRGRCAAGAATPTAIAVAAITNLRAISRRVHRRRRRERLAARAQRPDREPCSRGCSARCASRSRDRRPCRSASATGAPSRPAPASGGPSWRHSSSRRPHVPPRSRVNDDTGRVVGVALHGKRTRGSCRRRSAGSRRTGAIPTARTPRRTASSRSRRTGCRPAASGSCPRCWRACAVPGGGTGRRRGAVLGGVEREDQAARGRRLERRPGLVVEQADPVAGQHRRVVLEVEARSGPIRKLLALPPSVQIIRPLARSIS